MLKLLKLYHSLAQTRALGKKSFGKSVVSRNS
jgi:hypothetical protein